MHIVAASSDLWIPVEILLGRALPLPEPTGQTCRLALAPVRHPKRPGGDWDQVRYSCLVGPFNFPSLARIP